MGARRNRSGRVAAVILLAALTAGCGSQLADEELERALAPVDRTIPAASAAAASQGVGSAGQPAASVASVGAVVPGSPGDAPLGKPAPGQAGTASAATGSAASAPATPAHSSGAPVPPGATPPLAPPPAGAAAAPPAPGASPAPAGGGEIRLGSVGQASGLIGAAMAPIAAGARAWAADVNTRGGIGGRPVRLLQADDGGDPTRALAIVRRLVEEEHVQAFYSNFMVLTEHAIVGYLEERQVPAIGGCSCSSAVDPSPMLFPIGPGAPLGEAWAHVLPFLSLTDKRKASVLYCREAENCGVLAETMKGFAGRAGFQVVNDAQISIAQPDFTAEILAARNAGADVVVIIADNATAARAVRSAHRQDYHPTFSIQQAGFDDDLLEHGADVEGLVTAGIVPDHNTSPKLADYRAAMARLPGSRKATLGAGAWTAGKLVELLGPSLPPVPESGDFLAALHGLRGETLGGLQPPLTYEPGKGHAQTNLCIIPVIVRSGKFVAPNGDTFSCAPGWKPVGS